MGNCTTAHNITGTVDIDKREQQWSGIGQREKKVSSRKKFIAVRREVRSLSKEATNRLVRALERMMRNEVGPDTSEYLRIAQYYQKYSVTRNEQFPAWNRAHLLEMENALQAADLENGEDGMIALPYWDWTNLSMSEIIPGFIRRTFPHVRGLMKDPRWPLNRSDFIMPDDWLLKQRLEKKKVSVMVDRFLLEDQHFKAVTPNVSPNNLTALYDMIHMASGWPMTINALTSFQPLFYFHHCNIDRLYEKYIQLHPESERAFENTQQIKEQQGGDNLYSTWCKPFYNDQEEEFCSWHCFDIKKLGYSYENLPWEPTQQIREYPVYAVFFDVNELKLKRKSYLIHVFLQKKSENNPKPLPRLGLDFPGDSRYAGWAAIFGGRQVMRRNHVAGEGVNYYVELTETLSNLEVDPYEVRLDLIIFDEMRKRIKLEDIPGISAPKIRGPWFTRKRQQASKAWSQDFCGEAYMVQKWLRKYGWYTGKMDGVFGSDTERAVKLFQKFAGLKVDGLAGEKTKTKMLTPRYDANKDIILYIPDEEKVAEAKMHRNFPMGTRLNYHIGISPAYLNRKYVEHDITMAFRGWNAISDASGVAFWRTLDLREADLTIQWCDLSQKNDRRFDSRGGMLAESTRTEITLDLSERWLTNNLRYIKDNIREFYIGEVVAHEIGRVLGLGSSNKRAALMNPFYQEGRLKPTEHDIKAIKDLATIVS